MERCLKRELPENTPIEKHHIVPRAMKGSEYKCNLIPLTLREHFIAHLILWKGVDNIGINYFWYILHTKDRKKKLNSRQYYRARKDKQKAMKGERNGFYGKKHDEETKYKIGANRGKIFINKDGVNKSILPEEKDEYLKNGWVSGQKTKNKGKIWIHNGTESKMINLEEFDSYNREGWEKGRGKSKETLLRKIKEGEVIETKRVNIEEVDKYLRNGWTNNRIKTNRVVINNGQEEEIINKNDLNKFIKKGYVKGKLERVWVYNNNEEALVLLHELEEFLENGWKKGRGVKRKSIYKYVDGQTYQKYIPIQYLNNYIQEGWVIGRKNNHNKNRVWVHLSDDQGNLIDRKMINPDQIGEYRNKGYKRGQGKDLEK